MQISYFISPFDGYEGQSQFMWSSDKVTDFPSRWSAKAGLQRAAQDVAFSQLEQVIATDAGGRGIAPLVLPGQLQVASAKLLGTSEAVLATGFFIPAAQSCETDGPPGTLALAKALARLGIGYKFVTDAFCHPVFARAELHPLVPFGCAGLEATSRRVLVSIERVGRALDGRYYNMRGHDITAYTSPVDELFIAASGGDTTIGIGDGGNEIGMGRVHAQVRKHITNGSRIGTVVPTGSLIVAGTSNWGAWGLVAGLSLLSGVRLLPSEAEAHDELLRFVAAGAVDGVTHRAEATVDGLSWERNVGILRQLHAIVDGVLIKA